MVTLNGDEVNLAGKTISEYLSTTEYKKEQVAVEVNYVIIPKSDYDSLVLKDNDIVEVVCFMGGGSQNFHKLNF